MSGLKVTFDTAALQAQIDALQSDVTEALRPAAQAGAQVLYDNVLLNAPRGTKGHFFHGTSFKVNGTKYFFEAGTLRKAIYQAYATKESTPDRAVYSVGVNPRDCPYAYMVELGTRGKPGSKYIGRARAQIFPALKAAEQKFFGELKHFK